MSPGRKLEDFAEAFKAGDAAGIQAACEGIMRAWKDIDVAPLLALKDQLSKMGLEQRAAHLEEALISVAEKRPEPFLKLADEPDGPLWRTAVEVLSRSGDPELFDLLVKQAAASRAKSLPDVIAALGRYGGRAAEVLSGFLEDEDEEIFHEAVLALKETGKEGLARLSEALERLLAEGSERAAIIEAALAERREPQA